MKCLIVHGSYRKGNTYRVLSSLKSYMQLNGHVEFEEVFLSTLDVPYCVGCNKCFLKGESYCPHSSIIQPIVEKITTCDGLIITTPTYSLQVSGALKSWLDHMSYNFHRPRFFDKKALVVVTTAGAGAKPTAHYLKNILEFWGVNHISTLALRCFSFNYAPTKESLVQISTVANNFYNSIVYEKPCNPSFKQVFIFNLWRSMALSGKDNNSTDYLYWLNKGLLDKSYPPEVPLSIIKKIWAYISYKCALKMLR